MSYKSSCIICIAICVSLVHVCPLGVSQAVRVRAVAGINIVSI